MTNYLGWADWGSWNSCSVTCGTGTQSRTRSCAAGSGTCSGSTSESRSCSDQSECNFYLPRFKYLFRIQVIEYF